MANILHVERAANKITLGTTGTTINIASHTASTILGLGASKDLESLAIPLIVANGGTGLATITDGGLLLGSGTGAITPLAQATNGQLPIGSTGVDCVLTTLTGTAKRVIVTNGAGTITLSGPQDLDTVDSPTFAGLVSTGVIQATDFAKTGWPVTPGVTLSFVGGTTRTFTVTDGGSAYYYIDGVKYTLGENKTVVIDDLEGLWYIYFDGDTLTASQTIWSFTNEDKALVAYLYWARDIGTPVNGKAIFIGWELHSFHMSGATHARLHYAGGARWETGLLVADAGSEDVNVSAGDIWDEDLKISITDEGGGLFSQVLSPAQLPIYYRDGASAWRIYETNEKAAVADVGYLTGGILKYNDPTTTWSNETVGLNNYVAYYVVATNEQAEPVALIMGQRVDNKLTEAKANNVFSGLSLAGLPFEEMVVLARLILKDTATYTLEEVLDLRAYNIKGNITSPLITQHAGLGGLNWASAGHYFDAAVDFNAQNISNIGTVGCGVITQSGTTLAATYQPLDDVLTDLAALAVVADNEFIVGTGAGVYAHESGATARISIGLGNVENIALSTWAGTANITTLGTIATVGNITIANNGTIGNGVQLTFDDGNDYLEIAGCKVGILTPTPRTGLDVNSTVIVGSHNGSNGILYIERISAGAPYAAIYPGYADNNVSVGMSIAYRNAAGALQTGLHMVAGLANLGLPLIIAGSLKLLEQAAASEDVATHGQIWVKNTDPNELWFTDGEGNDHQIAYVV